MIDATDNRIVAAPGTGGEPLVTVFDQNGAEVSQFSWPETSFRGGLSVAWLAEDWFFY